MVSFQCHACGDVVKKPKLDQHHGRCHAGFDCIDCSVTFHTPTEYKSHVSCVSEAEKYQKGLYKGSQNGQENGNGNTNGGGRGGRGGFQGRGRGHGRGGFQGRGGRPRDEGTGANGTPLGSPQRMSPITTPVANTSLESKAEKASAPATLPSSDAAPTSSPAKNKENGPGPSSSERPKKEKKQKDKKSKSTSKSKVCSGEDKAIEPIVVEHASVPPPPSPDKLTGATEKKKDKKKRKGVKTEQAPVAEQSKLDTDERHANEPNTVVEHAPAPPPLSDKPTGTTEKQKKRRKGMDSEQAPTAEQSKVDADMQGLNDGLKEKKKKKKSKGDHPADDSKTDGNTQTEGNAEKREVEALVGDNSRVKADGQEKTVKSKEKQKKKSKDKVPDEEAPKVDSQRQGKNEEPKEGKKKEKKRKSEKVLDEPVASAEPVSAPLQSEGSETKSKKRKRDGERAEDERKKAKKDSKKDSHGADTTPAAVEVKDSTSKEPSSGKKRKRGDKEVTKDASDALLPEDGKTREKKRKHKKDVVEDVKE